MIRILNSLVLSLLLAACATTAPPRWERQGASDATNARDASDCSAVSWIEAERLHPYGPAPAPSPAAVAYDGERQRVDNDRFTEAHRLFALCMQNRGYRQVPAAAK